jgi:hypothetical protein
MDVCEGHARNVERFAECETAVASVLKVFEDQQTHEADCDPVVKRLSADVLALCMNDAAAWRHVENVVRHRKDELKQWARGEGSC